MRKKVLIYVEGQTEKVFVGEVLAPYLQPKDIDLISTVATTKVTKKGADFKGGIISYDKVRREILELLKDSSAILVTTMIDFYALPNTFPGYHSMPNGTAQQRVEHITEAFKSDINHHRCLPYFSLHEFEALLFSNPDVIARVLLDEKIGEVFHKIKAAFGSPEEINDDSPPSKRITASCSAYRKKLHGSRIADEIGLERIRQECSYFDAWVTTLENLAS